jgi:DNA-binding MarR family transcriptional regulator
MFDHCLYFNTVALARRVEQEWAQAFLSFGLTPPQAFMLRIVLAKPGMLQSELAAELVISRSTATRALDILNTKGFIERRTSKRDRRECEIYPTPEAQSLRFDLEAAGRAMTLKMKNKLGDDRFVNAVEVIKHTGSAFD